MLCHSEVYTLHLVAATLIRASQNVYWLKQNCELTAVDRIRNVKKCEIYFNII